MAGDPHGKPRSIDGLEYDMIRKRTAIPIEYAGRIATVTHIMRINLSLNVYPGLNPSHSENGFLETGRTAA